jgi:endonuclease/exonuclease/phosphatase family metal-dependent hydrolase
MDLKTQIDSNTVVVGDFNNPLSPIDDFVWMQTKKIKKEILELNDTIDLMELTDVYREFHRTFSKIDHILGHKESLNKYNNFEITPCILSDHNTITLELNNKETAQNTQTIGG